MGRKYGVYTKPVVMPALDSKAIGKRIRRVRKDRGWTIADLATVTGIPRATVACYESGARVPIRENLLRLSIALKRSVRFLALGWHGKRRRGKE